MLVLGPMGTLWLEQQGVDGDRGKSQLASSVGVPPGRQSRAKVLALNETGSLPRLDFNYYVIGFSQCR
jgi:hypothetical protein